MSFVLSVHYQSFYILYTGAFGKVFAGVLNDQEREMMDLPVAIKTIKSEGEMCKTFLCLYRIKISEAEEIG